MTLQEIQSALDRGYRIQRTGWVKNHYITRLRGQKILEHLSLYVTKERPFTAEERNARDWKIQEGQRGGPIYAPEEHGNT